MAKHKRRKNPEEMKRNSEETKKNRPSKKNPEKSLMETLKNPLGIPWWIWLGIGAGALYLYTRSRAQAAVPSQSSILSALQSQLNAAIGAALGYQSGDVLNISFPSATSGPVTVVDNKSGKTVLTTIQSPTTLLKYVAAGGLNQYYNQDITDPFTSAGWQKATITV